MCIRDSRYTNGLILVTGSVCSGKSTTLASIVDFINQDRHDHIITDVYKRQVSLLLPVVKSQGQILILSVHLEPQCLQHSQPLSLIHI